MSEHESDFSVSNSSSGCSVSDDEGSNLTEKSPEAPPMARAESRAVNLSKAVFYCVLLLAAVAVGTLTYFFVSKQEGGDFESDVQTFGREILKVTEINAKSIFGVLDSLSIAFTSSVHARNLSWPLVSMLDFERRAKAETGLSGAKILSFLPVVHKTEKVMWEDYANRTQGWIRQGLVYQGLNEVDPGKIPNHIYNLEEQDINGAHGETDTTDELSDSYAPVWQMYPAPSNASIVNMNLLSHPSFKGLANAVVESRRPLISEVTDLDFVDCHVSGLIYGKSRRQLRQEQRTYHEHVVKDKEELIPHSFILQPVFESFEADSEIVGFLMAILSWDSHFQNVLPQGLDGFVVYVHDSCGGDDFTYAIYGEKGRFLGIGDRHDTKYDHLALSSDFEVFKRNEKGKIEEQHHEHDEHDHVYCEYIVEVFPSDELHDEYSSNAPVIYAVGVAMVFVFTAFVFLIYDTAVSRRQNRVMRTFQRTQAIVSSLFPKSVQNRILEDAKDRDEEEGKNRALGNRAQLKDFLEEEDGASSELAFKSRPIADLFPETTVMFADIAGFTAWSSVREPTQVFTLLETIYHAFDEIAKRRRVFKVETVGDCYVAVAGLPEPRKDHAVVMARFARDCMVRMNSLTKQLEVALGPDTGELGMRFGLHSGQVTAGVLRGERSRFQLFGDTVNTTARMESTGERDKVHISQETADLLTAAGKGHWVVPRKDTVIAKGKGELQTYWLEVKSVGPRSKRSSASDGQSVNTAQSFLDSIAEKQALEAPIRTLEAKQQRLIDWNTALLHKLLQNVVARREAAGTKREHVSKIREAEKQGLEMGTSTVLDEVLEVINLPTYDAKAATRQKDPASIQFEAVVGEQLRDYVQAVASLYNDNPFHNFEHASHVTMSAVKLLSRIVAPELNTVDQSDIAKNLHDHTYGITSDPLTQFAVILAALIHDVDHVGVPNSQLVKEQTRIAAVYKNKSVAEQNSVDIAWNLLMEDRYEDLRTVIYTTEKEFKRFRQLVVNTVMATDIMDKDLGALRKARWNKAFSEDHVDEADALVNRRATIVIEHLIQASDVAHTMQHWHIYMKWNQRLFEELYDAYKQGRADKDPSKFWFQGEIGFLDFYVIPLAKKLKDCGVFGVSSDEYLNYAQQNRNEWGIKGQVVVEAMAERVRLKYEPAIPPAQPKRPAGPERLGSAPEQRKRPAGFDRKGSMLRLIGVGTK